MAGGERASRAPRGGARGTSLVVRLARTWYAPKRDALALALAPASWLFGAVVALRRAAYRRGWLRRERLPVPVVVVGNVTVGGTGKTPLVIALARALAEKGRRPGVISRGHGRAQGGALVLDASATADVAGDEPVLIARAGLVVAVGRDRAAAGRALLAAHPGVDVVLADDGLQHYRLARDFEVAVIDGGRGVGNGALLPAGPLREPAARLGTVDAVVVNGELAPALAIAAPVFHMRLVGSTFRQVAAPARMLDASAFRGARVHAVAAIGHPERFFALLRALGIDASTHAFPDHHRFTRDELAWDDADAVLMTEKDAVKCEAFADARCWFLPVIAEVDGALVERIGRALAVAR